MSRLSPARRKQLHQRLTEALDEHPAGMPAGTVYEIRRAFGISQSTFYDHQRRVTDARVRAGTGQLTVKQTVATRDGRWVPTDAMDPYLAITHATKLTKPSARLTTCSTTCSRVPLGAAGTAGTTCERAPRTTQAHPPHVHPPRRPHNAHRTQIPGAHP